MSKLMNLLRRNPRMTVAGIVLVIVLVAVVIWMVTRGEDKAAGPKPTIMFTSGSKVLNPAQKNTTETYIEYAAGPGTAGARTAEYIDLNIKWKNGAGFTGKVTGLKLERLSGKTADGSTTVTYDTTPLDTMYDTDSITDFADGEVTFLGSEIASVSLDKVISPPAKNYIKVYYTTNKEVTDTDTAAASSVSWTALTTSSGIEITVDDIDTTYDITSPASVNIPLTASSATIELTKTDGKITYYDIALKDGTSVASKVRLTVSSTGGVVTIKKADNTTFKFTTGDSGSYLFEDYMGNTLISTSGTSQQYLQVDGATTSFVDKSTIFTDQATLDKSLFKITETPTEIPLSYMYEVIPFKYETAGFQTYNLPGGIYQENMNCELECSADEKCVGVRHSNQIDSGDQDVQCYGLKEKPGEDRAYANSNFFGVSLKTPFERGIVENPKFVDGKAVVTGTPWAGTTGWETSMSSSAFDGVYKSWHPFTRDSRKMWASNSVQEQQSWVGIKYPRSVILKGYIISSAKIPNNYSPDKTIMQGSNDGKTWINIKEVVTPKLNGYGDDSSKYHPIIAREKLETNTTSYSQYRVVCPGNYRFNNISEIRLFTTLGV